MQPSHLGAFFLLSKQYSVPKYLHRAPILAPYFLIYCKLLYVMLQMHDLCFFYGCFIWRSKVRVGATAAVLILPK